MADIYDIWTLQLSLTAKINGWDELLKLPADIYDIC